MKFYLYYLHVSSSIIWNYLENGLNFVIKYQYDGTTCTTKNIGERALEEGLSSFRFGDGCPAVDCVLVDNFALGTARLHHHTPTDCVKRIRNDTSNSGDSLQREVVLV